jgi:hypothetical protein
MCGPKKEVKIFFVHTMLWKMEESWDKNCSHNLVMHILNSAVREVCGSQWALVE